LVVKDLPSQRSLAGLRGRSATLELKQRLVFVKRQQ